MSWLRLDDGFPHHPKFDGWSIAARWAWLEVMIYCARYETNGKLPSDRRLIVRSTYRPTTSSLLRLAEQSGWLDRNEDGTEVIHDWSRYNPKDPTKASRQARWRAKRDDTVDARVDAPVDAPVDDQKRLQDRLPHARASARVPVPLLAAPSKASKGRDRSYEAAPASSPSASAGARTNISHQAWTQKKGETYVRNAGWMVEPSDRADDLRGYFTDIPESEVERLCELAAQLEAKEAGE